MVHRPTHDRVLKLLRLPGYCPVGLLLCGRGLHTAAAARRVWSSRSGRLMTRSRIVGSVRGLVPAIDPDGLMPVVGDVRLARAARGF